ncbi:hypothetical protein N9L90_01290 [Planctomycetota bacterium]|jgi:hypothetical protein|nr:hypothetical protein [Planctomycetota bacterium]
MAEEENNPAEEQPTEGETQPTKKDRGAAKLLGGLVGLIATGSALAMMAIPAKVEEPRMTGPFEFTFFEEEDQTDVVTNIQDDNFSRYIKFEPTSLVFAYDETYPAQRRMEQGFIVAMRQAMSRTVLKYELQHIYDHPEAFNEELRQAAEPLLFPVCIGDAPTSHGRDPVSGLMMGDSQETAGTFRGDYYLHEITVDAKRGTLQLGEEGPAQSFNGSETDLMVEDRNGRVVYVDVTGVEGDFEGSVRIGVKGRIRRLITGTVTAQ